MFWSKAKTPALASTLILLAAAMTTIALQNPPVEVPANSPDPKFKALKSFISTPPVVKMVLYEERAAMPGGGLVTVSYKLAKWQTNGFLGMSFSTKEAMQAGVLTNSDSAAAYYDNTYWYFTKGSGRIPSVDFEKEVDFDRNTNFNVAANTVVGQERFWAGQFAFIMSLGILVDPALHTVKWVDNSFTYTNNRQMVVVGSLVMDKGLPVANITMTGLPGSRSYGREPFSLRIKYDYDDPPLAGWVPTSFDEQEPTKGPGTNTTWISIHKVNVLSLEVTNVPMTLEDFVAPEEASSNSLSGNFILTNRLYCRVSPNGSIMPVAQVLKNGMLERVPLSDIK